jgi:hypothetical protein
MQSSIYNIQYKKYLKIKLLENNIINKMLDTYVQCGYTEHGTESLHADGRTVVFNKTCGVRCAAAALMRLIVCDD